jgi:hypothetical protein
MNEHPKLGPIAMDKSNQEGVSRGSLAGAFGAMFPKSIESNLDSRNTNAIPEPRTLIHEKYFLKPKTGSSSLPMQISTGYLELG